MLAIILFILAAIFSFVALTLFIDDGADNGFGLIFAIAAIVFWFLLFSQDDQPDPQLSKCSNGLVFVRADGSSPWNLLITETGAEKCPVESVDTAPGTL